MTGRKSLLLFLFLLLPIASAWPQSEPLGKLFFTPQQRAALDRKRQLDLLPDRAGQEDAEALITINGIVRRSSGRHTTWINGVPNTDTIPGIHIPSMEDSRGKARRGSDAKAPPLKVGETYQRNSGERQDLLNGGEIAIRRSGAGVR